MPREASRPLITSACPALMWFLDSTIDSVVCTRGDTGAALAGPASASTATAATAAPDTVRVRDLRILLLQSQPQAVEAPDLRGGERRGSAICYSPPDPGMLEPDASP